MHPIRPPRHETSLNSPSSTDPMKTHASIRRPASHARPEGRRRHRGAFTIVEVLVVMGIIALLVAILVVALSGATKTATSAPITMLKLRSRVSVESQPWIDAPKAAQLWDEVSPATTKASVAISASDTGSSPAR